MFFSTAPVVFQQGLLIGEEAILSGTELFYYFTPKSLWLEAEWSEIGWRRMNIGGMDLADF